MPGLIDQLAAETEGRRQREAEADREAAASKAARDEREQRLRRVEARKQAMKAAQQMTGRVIFPARWTVVDTERGTFACTERIEGRIEVTVEVAVVVYSGADVKVETRAVLVRAPDADDFARWKGPGPLSHGRSLPASPGRDWFRRQLVELGIIGGGA